MRICITGIVLVLVAALAGVGCSSYTLTRISAADGHADLAEGATYRVTPPKAFLIPASSPGAVGSGQPGLELARNGMPYVGRDAIREVPAGTPVKIEQYVRFDQHGLYDCGSDGWKFAIASITEGPLRGTRFLIELDQLKLADRDSLLLEPSE